MERIVRGAMVEKYTRASANADINCLFRTTLVILSKGRNSSYL
jgi:hypothetical protein